MCSCCCLSPKNIFPWDTAISGADIVEAVNLFVTSSNLFSKSSLCTFNAADTAAFMTARSCCGSILYVFFLIRLASSVKASLLSWSTNSSESNKVRMQTSAQYKKEIRKNWSLAKLGAKLSAYLFTVFLHLSQILLFGKTHRNREISMQLVVRWKLYLLCKVKTFRFAITLNNCQHFFKNKSVILSFNCIILLHFLLISFGNS